MGEGFCTYTKLHFNLPEVTVGDLHIQSVSHIPVYKCVTVLVSSILYFPRHMISEWNFWQKPSLLFKPRYLFSMIEYICINKSAKDMASLWKDCVRRTFESQLCPSKWGPPASIAEELVRNVDSVQHQVS